MISRIGAVVAIVLTSAGSASAQDATGRIEGRVLASDARPAASARVAASGPSLQRSREAETDVRGYFRLPDLPVGTYQVRLALVGYRPVRFDGVAVRLGRTTSLGETSLEPQAFELGEIVVHADRPLVDVASAATATNLPSEQFSDLPTERNFRSIVSLAPQANLSLLPGDEVNIAGGTGLENAYYLDGVNITDPWFGATSSNLPYNFVRELQVKAAGYQAEFGRATGGIIDVITHSGSDRFRGEVFGFFTNDGLRAEPRFPQEGVQEAAFSDYDVGGSLGGPILKRRLWFFAAYDPTFHRQRVEVRGPDLPDDRLTEHLFATKLTWQAGPSTDVVVMVHGDPSRHRAFDVGLLLDSLANPEAIATLGHQGGLVVSALARRRFGGTAQAELGVARFTRKDDLAAASERIEPFFLDHTTGVVSGVFGQRFREHAARTGARGSVSIGLSRHAVKVGLEYEDNQLDELRDFSAEPGSPQGAIERLDDTTYIWSRGYASGSLHNRVITVYGQDSWRLGDRLTLNYGLRWDGQFLIGQNGKMAQRFTDQWQPRVGFTYQVGVLGSQKLFGSYGRFYEQIPLNVLVLYYNPRRIVQLGYDHDPRIDPSGADTLVNVFGFSSELAPKRDLEGQSFDEFTLGYERAVGRELRVGIRGISRALRWAVEDAFTSSGNLEIGNPGRGILAFTPRARRTYRALVLTLEKPPGRRLSFLASYVLSRTWGNYEGLYDYPETRPFPNTTPTFDLPVMYPNSTGLLPNDRTHVFKVSGSYRFDFGLNVGTAIAWISGTPRSELGMAPLCGCVFLEPRGSAGRTGALLDAGLRFIYALQPWGGRGVRPKVYLDLFHVGNRRTPVLFNDLRYLMTDAEGNPTTPNPVYGRPLVFQPPMSARLGLSVDFGAVE
jgi:carboxypeptidase family protein/TonB-dependent receptor-like protein